MFHHDHDQPKRSQFYKYRDDILTKNALVAHEDEDKVIMPEEDEPFTLFDPQPIKDYQHKLSCIKKTYQEYKDYDKAEKLYLEVIDEMPFYPDAYIELGDLSIKAKNSHKAISYYTQALTRCPYDIETHLKLAFQQDIANKQALKNQEMLPFPDLDIKHLLDFAKKKKEEEKDFRKCYHAKLRRQLTGAGFDNMNALTANKISDSDLISPALSNGAVIDSYMAGLALSHNDLLMAQYFYKKAILKLKYDLYSITHLAISYRFSNERELALIELTRYINKYQDFFMYYARALVNGELGNNREEQDDFIKFMCSATQQEMNSLPYDKSEILTIILQKTIDLEKLPIFVESEEQAKRICQIQRAFLVGQYLGDNDEAIQFLTGLIEQSPAQHFYYGYRGFLYYQQNKQDLAMLDFSLAILFAPQSALVNYYHCRASIYLARYELVYADIEEVNAANSIPSKESGNNYSQIKSTLNYQFAKECLDRGVNRLLEGYIIQAERIFYLGCTFNPTAILYYHYALALGLQGKYNYALAELKKARETVYYDFTMTKSIDLLIGIFTDELKTEHDISKSHRKKCERKPIREFVKPFHELEKMRKTPSHKPVPELKSQPLKKQSVTTVHIQSLLKEQEIKDAQAKEILLQQEFIEKEKKEEAEKLKKEKNKQKRKKQKIMRKERLKPAEQKTDSSGSSSDTEIDIPDSVIEPPVVVVKKPEAENLTLPLTDLEKKVFAYFAACKNHPDYKKSFKLLMVGGSITGKVREHLLHIAPPILNDIDLVTDIPREILQACYPGLKLLPEVEGLFQTIIDNVRIDIMCKNNLGNLSIDAMKRDFFALYMDELGCIYDPTGFSIYNILNKRLRCIQLPAITFKNDPLRILRAVYLSIKFDWSISEVEKQIEEDIQLLKPRLTENDGTPATLLHPSRFNSLLRRNFSQHLALENYLLMRDMGILVVLFPDIAKYLELDHDWICQQLSQTDMIVRVNMNVIYANFIVCAIMNEALAWGGLPASPYSIDRLKNSYEINANAQIAKSLLFQSQFSPPEKLHAYLPRSITSWKFFHGTSQASTPASASIPTLASKPYQNNRFGYYN